MANDISNAPAAPLPSGPNGDYLKLVGGIWVPATLNLADLPAGQGVASTELAAPDFRSTGMPGGFTIGCRFVGATFGGQPGAGTFQAGDFAIGLTGVLNICTVSGTPGTWVEIVPAVAGPAIQRGSVSITCTNTAAGTGFVGPAITFPIAYTTVPSVFFMLDSGSMAQGFDVPAQVVNRSTTGFTPVTALIPTQTVNRTYTLLWVAIGT